MVYTNNDMKSIIIFSKYNSEGPSSRQRSYLYLNYFNSKIETQIKPLFYEKYISDLYKNKIKIIKLIYSYLKRINYILLNDFDKSYIIIEKELFPYLPYFIEKIFIQKFKNKYSIDYDDAIFIKYERYYFLKNKHIKLTENSNFISIGNNWYKNHFDPYKCFYLPTIVDTNIILNNKINNTIPIIVWIGTPGNLRYLNIIINILKDIKLTGLKFILRIIGGNHKSFDFEIENYEWNIMTEYYLLNSSDIGIMPLFNSEWEQGKCGYKLIQYMNARLPVIASPTSANNDIVINNFNGFIANNSEEWKLYLMKLIVDGNLRSKLGSNARKYIINNYSHEKWAPIYLNKVCNKKNKK
jgi:glycosyltransferase involved in cell wall biosynthesis